MAWATTAICPQLRGQTVANQLGALGDLAVLGQTFMENLTEVLTGTGPGTVQEQIQGAIDFLKQGEFGQAFGNLAVLPLLPLLGNGLANIVLLPQLIRALQQPFADAAELFPIAAGPLGNAQARSGFSGTSTRSSSASVRSSRSTALRSRPETHSAG